MDMTTAIITSLAAGATAAAKDTASAAIKDLYKGLKDLLSKHLTTLPRLEKNPTEKAQEAAVEELSESEIKNDPTVAKAAANLADAIERDTQPGTLLAIDLERIRTAGKILIAGNVGGVRIHGLVAEAVTIKTNSLGN
jgi:hypothetical protein